jgi:hypothetical protein
MQESETSQSNIAWKADIEHNLLGLQCWCDPKLEMFETCTLVVHNRRQ